MSKKQEDFKEKRKFIRHPICVPLEFHRIHDHRRKHKAETVNLSFGGLLFLSRSRIVSGTEINVSLPFRDKIFHVHGCVVRCDKEVSSKLYSVGIEFLKVTDAFKVKLVEQLHLIEEYRSLRSLQLNREVSLKEASKEWITKYSEQFRKLYW
ncbi:MAG: PilZ domain-containing protein [Candidatus Omnitrophica bacterium]|nr:PilZ domain-containing protein [Candidatus Omnitrophota bacterium]